MPPPNESSTGWVTRRSSSVNVLHDFVPGKPASIRYDFLASFADTTAEGYSDTAPPPSSMSDENWHSQRLETANGDGTVPWYSAWAIEPKTWLPRAPGATLYRTNGIAHADLLKDAAHIVCAILNDQMNKLRTSHGLCMPRDIPALDVIAPLDTAAATSGAGAQRVTLWREYATASPLGSS